MLINGITDKLNEFVAGNSENYISGERALTPDMEGLRIYDMPLVGVAAATDPLFLKMQEPQVIGAHFRTPEQWLCGARSVISVFMPYSERIKSANAVSVEAVAVEWLHGRVEGQELLLKTGQYLKTVIEDCGFKAVIPFLEEDFWKVESHEEGYTSNWSERHIAYICGLGTFGLSKGLITRAGTAGRFISIITDMELPVTEREYSEVNQYCSLCGACIKRCPAGAICLESGKDNKACGDFVHHKRTDYPDYYGCGKCQTGVPCQDKNPRE